ncbi:MAG TPA: helix-turn-helix transcriptional regulator [Gaiellaceae bacterium]|nr:helix-turn-helix transcriptional regulator [Gaiellaceae bacterium]
MELKTARRIAQINQKELADQAGVDDSTISLLENGKRDYRTTAYEIIVRISRALHVEPQELFPIDMNDEQRVA